jgi:hypothetical protein
MIEMAGFGPVIALPGRYPGRWLGSYCQKKADLGDPNRPPTALGACLPEAFQAL